MNSSDPTVKGIVCHYAWGGTNQDTDTSGRGQIGEHQPASNGGTIRLRTTDGVVDLWFGGPGINEYIEITVDVFVASANALLRSYCYQTPITVTIRQLPAGAFPNIISVRAK